PALLGILQVRDHDLFENLLMYRGILQWTEDFDAAVEVPRHHVRGRDIHSRLRAGQALPHTKAIDSAVLQEAADDGFDADVLGKPGNARPQAADAAHHQVDRYAGLRRFVQRVDDIRVDQRVHLHPDHA